MAAIVQQTASGSSGNANAQNARGNIVGLAPTGIQTITSAVVGTRKLRGFSVHGTTDGEAWVEADSVELDGIRARISRVLPAYLVMPNPEVLAADVVLALRVQNTGPVAGDYSGTLFAE